MLTHPDDPHSLDDAGPWRADHEAVELTLRPAPPGSGLGDLVETLVHPSYPFVGEITGTDVPAALQVLAEAYLERLVDESSAVSAFAPTKWGDAAIPWAWYRLTWGSADRHSQGEDARLSFWTEVDAATGSSARTAVLLAGPQWVTSGLQRNAGGGEGLRVVLHVDPPDGAGKLAVRITGASFANPPLPFDPQTEQFPGRVVPGQLATLRGLVRSTLGLEGEPAVQELSHLPSGPVRIAGQSQSGTAGNPRVVAWSYRIRKVTRGDYQIDSEFLVEQVTHATDPVKAILDDPASCGPAQTMAGRRPTRDDEILSRYLHPAQRLPPIKGGPSPAERYHELQNPDTQLRVQVVGTTLSQTTFDPALVPQRVPATKRPLRSDDQAAVQAYERGVELMDRLQGSGLVPEAYFRFAKLPLILRHHAAMKKGNPDGHSVNAQVLPVDTGQSFADAFDAAQRPQLEVRFGAANLSHRAMHGAHHGRRRPQTLGLAADRRWAWHEFGHVLSYAATRSLEFPFAHSAGDALAAILNDPDSQLVTTGGVSARRDVPAGWLTFPWVPIKRRHDRDAGLGWCWCGRRNIRRISPLPSGARVFTGYFAEQLLSTTLFRVYRALGGDTFASPDLRRKAADYTAYLIMRAIQLLGPGSTVAADQATHFYQALSDADTGTPAWQYAGGTSTAGLRIGGMAHKVIRWAFEQQGLFATTSLTDFVEGIGLPPRVDVHVFGDGSDTDGGYGPYALDWVDPATPGPAPGWHASPAGMSVQGLTLNLRVRNRGTEKARLVEAHAWAAPAGSATLAWQRLVPPTTSPSAVDLDPRADTTFSFSVAGLAPGPCFLLAGAGCSADRMNLDPASGHPCAPPGPDFMPPSDRRHVTELVAGDNNLGLVLVDLP